MKRANLIAGIAGVARMAGIAEGIAECRNQIKAVNLQTNYYAGIRLGL